MGFWNNRPSFAAAAADSALEMRLVAFPFIYEFLLRYIVDAVK
jgi:hypothetical protein